LGPTTILTRFLREFLTTKSEDEPKRNTLVGHPDKVEGVKIDGLACQLGFGSESNGKKRQTLMGRGSKNKQMLDIFKTIRGC